jgi:hypothetical protein
MPLVDPIVPLPLPGPPAKLEGRSSGAKIAGVMGFSELFDGVHGETNANSFVAGVTGIAVNPEGVGPGVLGRSNGSGPGVLGTSNKDIGVMGFHGDPRLRGATGNRCGPGAGRSDYQRFDR